MRVRTSLKILGFSVVTLFGCQNENPSASSTEAKVPGAIFDLALKSLSQSPLILDAIPFQFAPDGCYARALLMSAHLASRGIPSSQYYVYSSPSSSFKISWNGKLVEWGYHVAPLLQPYGKEPQIFDPSVNNGSNATMTPENWVSKFSGPGTTVEKKVIAPGSCYVTDSRNVEPRPGCEQISFDAAKLVLGTKEMPKFRIRDLSAACSRLYTYLGGENTGFSERDIKHKKSELRLLVENHSKKIAELGLLDGQISEFQCNEEPELLQRTNQYIRNHMKTAPNP